MNFKEWIISESINPSILVPYINHKKDDRLSGKNSIKNHNLRSDYERAMHQLRDLFTKEKTLPVLLRRAMRLYEITRDDMRAKARANHDYMQSYNETEPDNDVWLFVGSLEDISNNKMPNLESLL